MATTQRGSQGLPYRNTGGSVSDDEAVPDTDPSDVCSILGFATNAAMLMTWPDIQLAPREAPSLQACCWIFGELHHRDREGGKSTRKGVREDLKGTKSSPYRWTRPC